MTYKKILESMIRTESMNWIESLLADSSIQYRFVSGDDAVIERDDDGSFVWSCRVKVYTEDYCQYTVEAGGTVDDMLGICKSVVWDENHMIVWMARQGTREALGIEQFKLRSEEKYPMPF